MTKTLITVLDEAASVQDRGLTFLDEALRGVSYSFADLVAESRRCGRRLLALGLRRGDRLGLLLPQAREFVLAFLGAVSVGVVPVPLHPPLALGRLDSYMDGVARILRIAGARMLITSKRMRPLVWALAGRVSCLEGLITPADLEGPAPPAPDPDIAPDDLCFLQFTSGSTADPKGVMVTHGNLIANTKAVGEQGLQLDPGRDVAVSWLPLFHDMGLIGFVITPLVYQLRTIHIPTLSFAKRPAVWMETISRYRGTITFAPNFAYALAAKRIASHRAEALDLRCLRAAGCGAEPIRPETMRAFNSAFAPFGLGPTVLMPAYGIAEATVAVSFHRHAEALDTMHIDRGAYERDGLVRPPARGGAGDELELVACGRPFDGHELRILAPDGRSLAEGRVGQIVLRGPSVTPGYFADPTSTARAFQDGWLYTGDLGFMAGGKLYVSGRQKDLVILNGRNYHPQDIEREVEQVPGVRKGNVAAFALPGAHTERLVIAAEIRGGGGPDLAQRVKEHLADVLGIQVTDVVLLPPGALPKTSSGKIQRHRARTDYRRGTLASRGDRSAGARASIGALVQHLAAGALAWIRHALR